MADLPTRLQTLRSTAEKILSLSGSAGASVGVLHQGKVILTENFGFRDHSLREGVTSDTLHNIGSLTKSMLAQAASLVVDDGLIAWSTPVSSIITEFRNVDRTITEQCTLIDLMSHRTGLPTANVLWYQGGTKNLVTKKDLIPMINALSPTFPFRSSWGYCNWTYSLAAEVLERVTGTPWQMIIKKRLWEPLGMQRTTTDARWKSFPNVAQGFMALEDASPFAVDAQIIDDSTIMGAAGGVCSNVNELLIYYRALMQAYKHQSETHSNNTPGLPFKQVPTVLSAHAVLPYPTLPAYNDTTYGLGWARGHVPGALGIISDNVGTVENMPIIGRGASPQQVFYHQGTTAGFYSSVYLLPDTESCVIVLVNTKPLCDSADWIAQLYLDRLLGPPETNDFIKLTDESIEARRLRYSKAEETLAKERVTGTKPRPLEQYCGRYHWASQAYFIDVYLDEDDLNFIVNSREDQIYKLKHYHYDTFTWLMTNDEEAKRGRFIQSTYTYKIVFSFDERQTVETFTWQEIGGGKALFKKVKHH